MDLRLNAWENSTKNSSKGDASDVGCNVLNLESWDLSSRTSAGCFPGACFLHIPLGGESVAAAQKGAAVWFADRAAELISVARAAAWLRARF
jgi:hypothetical protein